MKKPIRTINYLIKGADMKKNKKTGGGVELSVYDTFEKRVINGKIVNVTYHNIEWQKCFQAARDLYDKHGTRN